MQIDLGGSLEDTSIVAAYTYAARYVYSEAVVQNDNLLRLTAAGDAYQNPLTTDVITRPASVSVRFNDIRGNIAHRVRVSVPHQELTILSIGVVQLAGPTNYPAEVSLNPAWGNWALEGFLAPTPLVRPDCLAEVARDIAQQAPGLVETVELITDWVHRHIRYVKASTTVFTTAEEVMAAGVGVCQDMAHLALGLLRALGVPVRYVCGLLATEVGETHAWLEFWHPYQGWIPSDPSRGQAVANHRELLKFAVGRDYTEAAPVEGSFISRGAGWLDRALAQVHLERDYVSFDHALSLIDSLPDDLEQGKG